MKEVSVLLDVVKMEEFEEEKDGKHGKEKNAVEGSGEEKRNVVHEGLELKENH